MNLILLEDLEEEDLTSDYKSQPHNNNNNQYNTSQRTKNNYTNHYQKNGGGGISEGKRAHRGKDPNHLMVDGYLHHRRKSISAEPLPLPPGPGCGDNGASPGHGGRGDTPISMNGHYSSLSSVNNAITVAPSRTTFIEPNVFAGGRSHHNNHHHRKPHHHQHRKHKVRSRSPDDPSGQGYQSILNRIDNSILKNFGDWTNVDDDGLQRKNNRSNLVNNNNNNNLVANGNRNNKVPYFIPQHTNEPNDLNNGGFNHNNNNSPCGPNDLLSLPKLYKGYDHVVKTSNQVLNDKSYRIALSKDNNDPDSILSEAKRTLAQFGGGRGHPD